MCGGCSLLEWLDTLISVTLNPVKSEVGSMLPEDINKLQGDYAGKGQSAVRYQIHGIQSE